MREKNEYVLGTHKEELERLGFQHQVWAKEAHAAWRMAGFTQSQTILDLGSGPGFATVDLARIVGSTGRVIAVDKSEYYVKYLSELARTGNLPIEAICSTFSAMQLEANSLDGVFDRWALAWIDEVDSVLDAVINALKPGGKMICHEYFDWTTFQTEPVMPGIERCKAAILASFDANSGYINIGRMLPAKFNERGMDVNHIRPLARMCRPKDLTWNWPGTFLRTYLPRVVEMGHLHLEEMNAALNDWDKLESDTNAVFFAPLMIEVIAEKL